MKQTDKNFFDAIPQIGTKELNNLAKEMVSGKPKSQTAVEFLISKLQWTYGQIDAFSQYVREAKELEKQQIIDAYADGRISVVSGKIISYDEYYNETFKNK